MGKISRIQESEGPRNPNRKGQVRLFKGCLSVCSSEKWRKGFCLLLRDWPWANHDLWASISEIISLNGCLWGLSHRWYVYENVAQSLARAEVVTGFLSLSCLPASLKWGTSLPEQAAQRDLLEGFQPLSITFNVYCPASNALGSLPSDSDPVFHVLPVSKWWRKEDGEHTHHGVGVGGCSLGWNSSVALQVREGQAAAPIWEKIALVLKWREERKVIFK